MDLSDLSLFFDTCALLIAVWMYFPRNHAGEDSETGIWYIGFKGLASGVRREVVKNVVYESAPRPQDHSGKADAEGEKFKNKPRLRLARSHGAAKTA